MASRRSVLIGLILLLGWAPLPASASESAPLVTLAKTVIRTAAKIGLNEAGTRILGPTVWGYFKEFFAPVWMELENRYPDLTLKDTKRADAAAEQAVARLDSDRQLQQRLSNGFLKLETGQQLILAELNRINEILEANRRDLNEAKALTASVLDELQQLRKQRPASELVPADPFENVKGMTAAVLRQGWLSHLFTLDVLERGEPFRVYKKILPYGPRQWSPDGNPIVAIDPTAYAAIARAAFKDSRSRDCRAISMTAYRDNAWQQVVSETVYCRHEGMWEIRK
jgi:hypothetical protein